MSNSFMLERRKQLGLVGPPVTLPRQPVIGPSLLTHDAAITPGAAGAPAAALAAAVASAVDRRSRWGWPWITSIQD
ncbi:hypothetical protein [Paraburkholderia xenovorans]|uniref:hypothetical protein n=1 Tax=Paraburkholderia xenovorans TaxID=36873 RepID=UPI0038BD9643